MAGVTGTGESLSSPQVSGDPILLLLLLFTCFLRQTQGSGCMGCRGHKYVPVPHQLRGASLPACSAGSGAAPLHPQSCLNHWKVQQALVILLQELVGHGSLSFQPRELVLVLDATFTPTERWGSSSLIGSHSQGRGERGLGEGRGMWLPVFLRESGLVCSLHSSCQQPRQGISTD